MGKRKNIVRDSTEEKNDAKAPKPLPSDSSEMILSEEVDVIVPRRSSRPSAQLNLGGKEVKNPYKTPEPRIPIIRTDNPKFKGAKKT